MRLLLGFVLSFMLFVTGPALANKTEITDATSKFYAALNTMFKGNVQPMKDLWSHSSDVTYMGPDGTFQIGWDQVEKEWLGQAAAKLGGEVRPTQIKTVIGSDLAIVYCIEAGENIVNGKKETVQIRSSTAFRKEGKIWKVVGHQTDMLEFLKNKKK
ncbi:MAG: YybH family protein [Hyphomicrobium sp.]